MPPERSPGEERVRRRVARMLGTAVLVLVLLAALGLWAQTGFYRINPGEAAIILQLGKYKRTEALEGLRWHLPPPIQSHEIVRVGTVQREEFGDVNASDPGTRAETAMQTSDNNIVFLEFVVRYRVGDPFLARYRIADLRMAIRDAAQAAMRDVVGRNTIDGVLSDERGNVENEATDELQAILDSYHAGVVIQGVELQEVQPPAAVREAFDDVIAASQDSNRKVNEAEGYANEVIPHARAEATEIAQAAIGYRDATIAKARGEAERFLSLLAEYQKAPAVTRERLYLESLEKVLPDAKKVLVEPGSATVLPYLPLAKERGDAGGGH